MDIDMDIKELEAFVYVVENCSFSRAAELLHLTQPTISSHISALERKLGIKLVVRTTKETDIRLALTLDGSGQCQASTGIGFFDHMLDGFARHGIFDLEADVRGDLQVDCHHTVEDTGIVLGEAIRQAVGDKAGIRRLEPGGVHVLTYTTTFQ